MEQRIQNHLGGPFKKTHMIHRPPEDGVWAISRSPGNGVFDPRQAQIQADFMWFSSPCRVVIGVIAERRAMENVAKETGKGKRKTGKFPFRHLRKGPADRVIVEGGRRRCCCLQKWGDQEEGERSVPHHEDGVEHAGEYERG